METDAERVVSLSTFLFSLSFFRFPSLIVVDAARSKVEDAEQGVGQILTLFFFCFSFSSPLVLFFLILCCSGCRRFFFLLLDCSLRLFSLPAAKRRHTFDIAYGVDCLPCVFFFFSMLLF